MQVSRGKPDRFHRTPAGFTAVTLGGYGFRYLLLAHPITPASYPVSVRQVAVLLHASFRPHLAVTPLRFASTSPPPGYAGDFHPQAVGHARHTKKAPQVKRPGRDLCGPYENRTRVSALRGRRPGPLDEWADSSRENSTRKTSLVNASQTSCPRPVSGYNLSHEHR